MRILVLHSRYRSGDVSGENRAVDDDVALLREGGHDVRVWMPTPRDIRGFSLVATAAGAIWSRDAITRIRALVRRHEPDVMHVHNLFPLLSPAVIREAARRIPVVATLHSYRLMCIAGTLFREGRTCELCVGRSTWSGVRYGCYRGSRAGSAAIGSSLMLHRGLGTFRQVRLFLAVSRFLKDKHVAGGIPAEAIRIRPHFAAPASPPATRPGRYFLYLGRLSAEKGVATLLQAWRLRSPGRLIVVGEGPERRMLAADAPAGVEVRGSVDAEAAARLVAGARAVVIPSRSFETGSRVAIEAAASGVPVLASRIGALPEIVEEGRSGFLLPPSHPEPWAEAAERVGNDAEALRLGSGARQVWEQRFTPERALTDLESAYEAATEGSSRR